MRYQHLLLAAMLLNILSSCTNNSGSEQKYLPLKEVIQQQYPSKATGNSMMINTMNTTNKKADSGNNKNVPSILSSPPVAGQVALNPPHGQPGHRCDIPVGMPLDTKPADAGSIDAQPSPTNNLALNTNIPIGKGLNPPHGQPGHRCDIAVGAPLDSKPITPASNTIPPKTPKGLNPPHGQPGHRCDIAVGAPLDSKPAFPAPVANTQTEPIPPATNCVTGTQIPGDGLNPEHGKAGHRCDVKVGAPLAGIAPPSLADKLNPPHGQSGHRCDIAVGAFIDSPKAGLAKDSSKS